MKLVFASLSCWLTPLSAVSLAGQEAAQSYQAAAVGSIPVTSEGSHSSARAVAVDSLRRLLQSLSSQADVSGVLQILDVVSARTPAELHERTRRLPVAITYSKGEDRAGRSGVFKTFTHRSGHKRTFFMPDRLDDAPPLNTESPNATDFETPGGETESVVHSASSSSFCEYTDPDNQYYSGECATQQDIEDLQIAYVAMEAEAAYAQSVGDAATEFDEYCHTFIIPPPECPQDGEPPADPFPLEGMESDFDAIPDLSMAPLWAPCAADCTGYAIAYGTAVLNWGWRAFKIASVLTAIAPPVGAIVEAGVLGAVGLGGLAAGAWAYHNCAHGG